MKKVGNVVLNKIYNFDNKKFFIFVDVEEVDSVMEWYICLKYMNWILVVVKKYYIGSSEDIFFLFLLKILSWFGFCFVLLIFLLGFKKKLSLGCELISFCDDWFYFLFWNKGFVVFGVSFLVELDKVEDME